MHEPGGQSTTVSASRSALRRLRCRNRDLYRLSDTVNDLSCGIVSQMAEALFKTALFAGYMALYERARLFDLPATAWCTPVSSTAGTHRT